MVFSCNGRIYNGPQNKADLGLVASSSFPPFSELHSFVRILPCDPIFTPPYSQTHLQTFLGFHFPIRTHDDGHAAQFGQTIDRTFEREPRIMIGKWETNEEFEGAERCELSQGLCDAWLDRGKNT
jgi:hypothetical protein